jgi:hypothetical protein
VVTASRAFVCVRPLTFEDPAESELLRSVFAGHRGQLENTVFAVLDPTGGEQILHGTRSPRRLFAEPADFAARLDRVAQRFQRLAAARRGTRALPLVADLTLAVNVAACDSLPLAVVVADEPSDREALAERLAELAWSEAFVGRLLWVAPSRARAEAFEDLDLAPGVTVLQPDPYGQTAKVLARAAADAEEKALAATIAAALAAHDPAPKTRRAHVREGKRRGLRWEAGTSRATEEAAGDGGQGRPADRGGA